MPLVVVREINCGRAVNYSSEGLKGPELPLAPAIPLSGPSRFVWALYPSGPQPGNINDVDHKKRLFSVHGERERRWTEGERYKERGREGRASREILLGISQVRYVFNKINGGMSCNGRK